MHSLMKNKLVKCFPFRKEGGFTLIEMLTVCAIIGILASKNVIPLDLAEKLQSLVSIRNKLVNLDPELDILTVF